MADQAESIEIEFGDDDKVTVIEGTAVDITGAPAAARTDDPLAGVEDLKRQVESANRTASEATERAIRESNRAADADRRAAAAAADANQARVVAGDSQYDSIVNALSAKEREMEQAQTAKAAALEAGDYPEVAKLDGKMARLGAAIVNLEGGKSHIEEQRKVTPKVEVPAPAAARTPSESEQNEAWLAGLNPRSAQWIRAHPRFFTDKAFQAKVLGAAQYAEVNKGLSVETEAYFQFIENEVGLSQQAIEPGPLSAAAAPVQSRDSAPTRAAPPIAATPSRSVPGPTGRPAGNRITLSQEERDIARTLFPKQKPTDPDPEVAYARNKMLLIREGRMSG